MSADPAHPEVRSRCEPHSRAVWAVLSPEWQRLAEIAAEVPSFLGRTWVGTWLDVYGEVLEPVVWTCRSGSDLSAVCLLTARRERRGPIPFRCLYLNTSGEAPGEGVCAEYNQVLCRPGSEREAARELGAAIRVSGADELVAGGITPAGLEVLRLALPGWTEEIRWSEDPYVDLARLRKGGTDYRQGALSRNGRAQLGRTLRAYSELGSLETQVARTSDEALALLDELIQLHQAAWLARGLPGAFASERMCRFHRTLIARGWPEGLVHLVRVSVGAETIGVLYNLVDRGRIYFYQSGLRYREGNHYRPGIAAHASAIESCLRAGFDEYHFLAGDTETPRYKQALSTAARQLAWVRLLRPGLKSASIRGLRALRSRVGGRR